MSATGQQVWPLQKSLQILSGTNLSAVGAANKWAGTVTAKGDPELDLLGALNYKNGTHTGKSLLDLNLVCNQLAGTVGYEADYALYKLSGGT